MKRSSKITVPTLPEASAVYADLQKKKLSVQLEKSQVADKIAFQHAAAASRSETLVGDKRARVAAILGEETPKADNHFDQTELHALEQRLRDLESAIEVINGRLAKERAAASRTICDGLKPHYAMAVRNIVEQMVVLYEAIAQYDALKDGLIANDVAWTGWLPPMGADSVKSRIESYMREAATEGFVKVGSLPKGVVESGLARAGYV